MVGDVERLGIDTHHDLAIVHVEWNDQRLAVLVEAADEAFVDAKRGRAVGVPSTTPGNASAVSRTHSWVTPRATVFFAAAFFPAAFAPVFFATAFFGFIARLR